MISCVSIAIKSPVFWFLVSSSWFLVSCSNQKLETRNAKQPLVRQRIKDVVDAEFVSGVGVVNRLERVVRPLPPITDVIVVVYDHHQSSVLIFHPQEFRSARLSVGCTNIQCFDGKKA